MLSDLIITHFILHATAIVVLIGLLCIGCYGKLREWLRRDRRR